MAGDITPAGDQQIGQQIATPGIGQDPHGDAPRVAKNLQQQTITPGAPVAPVVADPAAPPSGTDRNVAEPPAAPAAPPAAPAAPPAAPVPPVVPEPAPEPAPAPEPGNEIVKIDHDDVNVQAVQSLLADHKVTEKQAADIFGKAVQSGDLKDIDVAKLKEVLGSDAKVNLALAGLRNFYETVGKTRAETLNKVYAAFGGGAGWKAAQAYFQSKQGDATVEALKGMLDAGGIQAELAIERMVAMYVADPNTSTGNLTVPPKVGQADVQSVQKFANRVEMVNAMKAARTDAERESIMQAWRAQRPQ